MTRATIGNGLFEVADGTDISGLNRDIGNVQETTRDVVTGALDRTMTIDNRWFSEDGRGSIEKDFQELNTNISHVANKYWVSPNNVVGGAWALAGSFFGAQHEYDAENDILNILTIHLCHMAQLH